jgi:hypothetical protein
MKKINLILLFFTLLTSIQLKAQNNYQPGFAILNDGTRVGGLIALNDKAPWLNQRFIYLQDSASVAASGGKTVKPKKYVVDDLKFYKVGDRSFTRIHYVDYENLQAKSLGSNNHMLEILALGRIKAYRFYAYPQEVYASLGAGDNSVETQQKNDENEILNKWKMLSVKDKDEKYNNAFDYDLQKYFGDTPEVWEKYKRGDYGNDPISEKKGLAARMVAMAKKAAYSRIKWESLVDAIKDYNSKNMGSAN